MTARIAYLHGTSALDAWVELVFDPDDRHATQPTASLTTWVKRFPERTYNPSSKTWTLTGLGVNPLTECHLAGFWLQPCDTSAVHVLATPVSAHDAAAHRVMVAPGLIGVALQGQLPPSAAWDGAARCFVVPERDMAGHPLAPRDLVPAQSEQVCTPVSFAWRSVAQRSGIDEHTFSAHARALGSATKPEDVPEAFAALSSAFEVISAGVDPSVTLSPFQQCGALAVAAGHTLLSDAPGLGKTLQSLHAVMYRRCRRTVIVAPNIAFSSWQKEVVNTGLARGDQLVLCTTSSKRQTKALPAFRGDPPIVVAPSDAEYPQLPASGVVIVGYSSLKGRLSAWLSAWQPDAVIADESQRIANWDAARSIEVRALGSSADLTIAVSGTPLNKSAQELMSQLDFTGHLDPIFGGFESFAAQYLTKRVMFIRPGVEEVRYSTRMSATSALGVVLEQHVSTRRRKADVLSDMPPKTRLAPLLVEVDQETYQEGELSVISSAALWARATFDAHGIWPNETDIADYIGDGRSVCSVLRRAAGLAKLPAARAYIGRWLADHPANSEGTYDDPLIIFAHHKDVIQELEAAARVVTDHVATIIGSTTNVARAMIEQEFQSGHIAVLIGNIQSASVSVTLTRANHVTFAEFPFENTLVSQAEDRVHRFGQRRPCTSLTIVGMGTLDEFIHAKQSSNASVLERVMPGGDHHTAQQSVTLGDGSTKNLGDTRLRDVAAPLVATGVQRAVEEWESSARNTPAQGRATVLGVVPAGSAPALSIDQYFGLIGADHG